jgi:flagellar biogenesis protein FliO
LPLSPPTDDARGKVWSDRFTPLETGAASLGLVAGLFLLVAWVARRGGPHSATPLPHAAVEVLGRAPLVGRQHVHLVRCGNKLLLVCVLPGGAQTLTEVTDPAEVERLVSICQGRGRGTGLGHLLGRLLGPRRHRDYFARNEDAELDFARLESMHHAAHREDG